MVKADKPKLIHVKKGGKTKRYLVYDGKRYKIDSPYDDKFVISKLTKVIEKLLEYNARKKRRKVYKRKQTVPNNSPSNEKVDKVENNQYGNVNKVLPQQIVSAISRDLNPKYEDARAVEYRKDLIKMLEDQAKVKERVYNTINNDLAMSFKLLKDKEDEIKERKKDIKLLESQVRVARNKITSTDRERIDKANVVKAIEYEIKNKEIEIKKVEKEEKEIREDIVELKERNKDLEDLNRELDDIITRKDEVLAANNTKIVNMLDLSNKRFAALVELEKEIVNMRADRDQLRSSNELKNINLNRAAMRQYYSNPKNIRADDLRKLAQDLLGIDPIRQFDPKKNPKTVKEVVDEMVNPPENLMVVVRHNYITRGIPIDDGDVDIIARTPKQTPRPTPRQTPKGSAKKDYTLVENTPTKNDFKPEDLTKALDNIAKEGEASGSKMKEKEPVEPRRSARLSAKEILNKSKVILSDMHHETLREFMKNNGHGDIMLAHKTKDKMIEAFLKKPGMPEKVIEDNEKKVLKDVEDKTDELKKEVEEAREAEEKADKAKEKADEAEEEAKEEMADVHDKLEELDNIAGVFNPDADQGGAGMIDSGLTNFEIEKFMKDYDKDGFIGVYAIDQLKKIKKVGNDFSFIMNTQPINVPIGHWIAVKIDRDTIEYYDSFAGDPPDELLKWLKKRLAPNVYQLKINRTKFQKANTSNCGYFAMDFLAKRYGGESFKEATGFKVFEDSIKGEKEIKKLKKSIQEFGFINIKK